MIDISSSEVIKEIDSLDCLESLQKLKVQYFGKSGLITSEMKKLGSIQDKQERKEKGQQINSVRQAIMQSLEKKVAFLKQQALEKELMQDSLDVTRPVNAHMIGHQHPIGLMRRTLYEVLVKRFGFELLSGPEIESQEFNFDKLNIPAHHPSSSNA